ncbi:MAG: Gfo/Idh/MocA family oxidoreductase, partial [Prolixibacteraceae bacterium]
MKRVAIAGFGFMGMTHALNILRNKDLQLVAIIDKNPENIEKNLCSAEGNIQTGRIDPDKINEISRYSSLDECLGKEELDAVHICVHTELHYEMTKKALLQNKHVFLEKPICLDVDMAEELISLAGERQKI